MVSRAFGEATKEAQGLGKELQTVSRFASRTVLPLLGLNLAFSLLGQGLDDATSGGRAASAQMYRMRTVFFDIRNEIGQALAPILEDLANLVVRLGRGFQWLNDQFDGKYVEWVMGLFGLGAGTNGQGTTGLFGGFGGPGSLKPGGPIIDWLDHGARDNLVNKAQTVINIISHSTEEITRVVQGLFDQGLVTINGR